MNTEFKKGLDRKRIVSFPEAKKLVNKEIESAIDDWREAVNRYENGKFKYATITAYYSIFHSVRALVYSRGYREKSHYYLLVAFQSLFVEEGIIPESLGINFHDAMVLREDADYHGEFSKVGAEVVIDSAKQFIEHVKNILRIKG